MTQSFDTHTTSLMKRGVQRLSAHATTQAPPINPQQLQAIVRFLRTTGPSAQVITVATLIDYHTLLRQGNLIPSGVPTDPGHAIKASDITTLLTAIIIRSTKTRSRPGQALRLLIPRMPGSNYCAVGVWETYMAAQRLDPDSPAFLLTDGSPLQPATLLRAIQMGLAVVGECFPWAYMLHSLQRGRAQACATTGGTLQEVMELGSWASIAVHTYGGERERGRERE